jgi:hypothetical protein
MGHDHAVRRISVEQWFEMTENIQSLTLTPWFRVANNLFFCSQWYGREVLERTERQYFGLFEGDILACSLEIYFISPQVIRTRNLFCRPEFRRRGLMRRCLFGAIRHYRERAKKAIAFSILGGVPFYLACGYRPSDVLRDRPLEFYNFETDRYELIESDFLTLMELDLQNLYQSPEDC